MNLVHAAQAGQGGVVTIACINKATTPLSVDFTKLTAALQKCFDEYFLPVWGYPVKLYNLPSQSRPTGSSCISTQLIRLARSAITT